VDEEVRQDQYKKLWDRYGNLFLGAAFLVIAVVGGFKGWQYYQLKQSEAAALVYFDAVKKQGEGKPEDALAAFGAVTQAGYRQVASIHEAAALASQGKTSEAVGKLDALAADPATDPSLADVARIRAGYLLSDSQKPDELLTRLGRFDTETSIWRHAAREIFGLSAWRNADYAMADRYFNAIYADVQTPPGLRQRAQLMIQLITPMLQKP
jgi:hypothetical protein